MPTRNNHVTKDTATDEVSRLTFGYRWDKRRCRSEEEEQQKAGSQLRVNNSFSSDFFFFRG